MANVCTMSFCSRPWLLALVASMVLWLGGCAQTSTGLAAGAVVSTADRAVSTQVERFAELYVQVMPVGELFEDILKRQPNWPLHKQLDKVSAQDIACMRSQLSVNVIRNQQRQRALRYATTYPSRLDDDMRLMQGAVGKLLPMIVKELVHRAESNTLDNQHSAQSQAAMRAPLSYLNMQEVVDWMRFYKDPAYRPLRELFYFSKRSSARDMGDIPLMAVPVKAAMAYSNIQINQL